MCSDYRGLKKLIAEARTAEVPSSASTTVGILFPQPSHRPTGFHIGAASDANDNDRTRDLQDVIDISARAAARLRDANDDRTIASTTSLAIDNLRSTKTASHIRHSMFGLSPGLTRRRTRGLSLASICTLLIFSCTYYCEHMT